MVAAAYTDQSTLGDYFTESLGTAFAILVDSLPGSSAAVYFHERGSGNLLLQKSGAPENTFAESIPAGALGDLYAKGSKGGQAAARVDSDEIRAQLLTHPEKHPDVVIMVRPLCIGDKQVGLLVVNLYQEMEDAGHVLKSIDLVGRIFQSNLALQSQLEVEHTENVFLTDLVGGTIALDISSTLEVLVKSLVRLIKDVLTFDRLTISMQSSDVEEKLRVEWVEGPADDHPAGSTYVAAGVIHGEVFRQAQPIRMGCLKESGYKGRFAAGDFSKTRLISFLGVPIIEAGMPRGVLALESTARDHYAQRDLDVLKAIVQVYGTALCWTQKYQEVHAQATIDGLTQLLNHRSFMERFGQEIERASRYKETMTFLMLDLDNFKRINDTYGHLHGDYVLWQTARLIHACIRKADIAGRYGGEEFAVIIINADKHASRTTAERIRNTIADFRFSTNGVESRISVSIGMSEYPVDGADINTLVSNADRAMYIAKRQGGNEVISYSPGSGEKEQKGQ